MISKRFTVKVRSLNHFVLCQNLNMDLSNLEETPGIIQIASAKRKLRFSPNGKPLNPQPEGPKIRKKKSKYIGVFFEKQPMFLSINIGINTKAKTIRKLTEDTVEVKCKTKTGTKWIYGRVVAHGGKFTLVVEMPQRNKS